MAFIHAMNRKYPGWVDDPKYVYVGRWRSYQRNGIDLGNPHPIKPYICSTCTEQEGRDIVHQNAAEAVAAYKADLSQKLKVQNMRAQLKGKIPVCHCPREYDKDNTPICHIVVIREWVSGQGTLI